MREIPARPLCLPSTPPSWRMERGRGKQSHGGFPTQPQSLQYPRFSEIRNIPVAEPLLCWCPCPVLPDCTFGVGSLESLWCSAQWSQHHLADPAQPPACCAGEASPCPSSLCAVRAALQCRGWGCPCRGQGLDQHKPGQKEAPASALTEI